MPTYVYRREDGTTFEVEQRITDDALDTCPTTGQTVTRVISGGTGLIFKGSGFYLTDYARKEKGKPAVKASTNGKSESTSDSGSTTEAGAKSKSDVKPKSDKALKSGGSSKSE